jgi:hypothetical protein
MLPMDGYMWSGLTVISKMHRQQLIDRAREAQHGTKLAELKELERAIEVAESAVEAGRDEVRLEAGLFDLGRFNQLAAPVEQKASAPWLRQRKLLGESNEQIYVVIAVSNVRRHPRKSRTAFTRKTLRPIRN